MAPEVRRSVATSTVPATAPPAISGAQADRPIAAASTSAATANSRALCEPLSKAMAKFLTDESIRL